MHSRPTESGAEPASTANGLAGRQADPVDTAGFRESVLLSEAGFRHAFFTRRGGVSNGAYSSLNFSVAVGDSADNVRENIARAARALGVDAGRLYFLSQVHGRDVVVVDGSEDREQVLLGTGDAVVTHCAGVACAVRIADCVPVLLADRTSGAVAAIHAGWRGIVAGVIEAGVGRLRHLVGANGDLVAAIGPHISVDAFEVSEDVAAELVACSPAKDVALRTPGRKPHVDLARIVRAKLQALAIADECIDRVPGCTFTDSDDFFSYRRDGARSGRHLAAIVCPSTVRS